MEVLALDLATKTGWACSHGMSGVQDFTLKRGESPGMKWLRFKAWLKETIDLCGATLIVYEQAHHRGGAATHSAHALISRVEEVAAEWGLQVTNYHTSQIKKHAVGRGNASKTDVLEAAREKWTSVEIVDDNQADALFLLDLALSDLGENDASV